MSWPSHQFYMWLRGLARQGKTTFGGLASGPAMRLPTSAGLRLPMHSDYDGYDLNQYSSMVKEVSEWNAKNEKDPNGLSSKEPGSKLDAGKTKVLQGVLQYFPLALSEVARVSEKGADKYAWEGWKSVSDGINRYGNALARHLLFEAIEGKFDRDTGLLHAAQVAWNALARLELILKEKEKNVKAI